MPIGLIGRRTRGPQLLVDHELGQRIGVQAERLGPVRHHVAGLGQLASGGVGVRRQPVLHGQAAGVVVAGEAEVHGGSVFSALASRTSVRGGGAGGCRRPTWSGARVEAGSPAAANGADDQLELRRRLGDGGRCPARPVAVTQGERNVTWREFDRGADGIAQFLLDLGVVRQDKVAMYLYNCPEYLQTLFAAMKIGLVPVNTNYRYGDDELTYLWDNADAVAVVFHGAFADRIERILDRVPGVKGWLWVDDGSGPCPDWATPYEDAAKSAIGRVRAPWGRSGDDLYMLYTGGTTGMPKGVMWRQDDLFVRLIDGGVRHYPVDGGLEAVRAALGQSGRRRPDAGLPAHARDRRLHRQHRPGRGRAGLPARVAQVRPGRAARHGPAREGQRAGDRGRPLLPPAARRAGRAPRAGTSARSSWSSRRGRCGASRSSRSCSPTTPA